LIAFRTIAGNRCWVQPQFVASIFEVVAKNVEGMVEDGIAPDAKMFGLALGNNATFWMTRREGERVVRELAKATGDEWKLNDEEEAGIEP
jgi:hypothetical protein